MCLSALEQSRTVQGSRGEAAVSGDHAYVGTLRSTLIVRCPLCEQCACGFAAPSLSHGRCDAHMGDRDTALVMRERRRSMGKLEGRAAKEWMKVVWVAAIVLHHPSRPLTCH